MTIYIEQEKIEEDGFLEGLLPENAKILGLDKLDGIAFSKEYFNKKLVETSIDPNANVNGISPNNYLSEMAKPYAKYYFFKKLYEKGKELWDYYNLMSIWDGSIYIHDATKLQPYCVGVSSDDVAIEGRPYSSLVAKPPQRLESFMGQITEFMMDCSQEWAGAVANTNLPIWMAYFIKKGKGLDIESMFANGDNIKEITDPYIFIYDDDGVLVDRMINPNCYTNKEIENIFQSFVHVLNNNFRVGGDSPFTNISVNSKAVYMDLYEDKAIHPDGTTVEDLWDTIERVQRIIVDFMGKGRPDGLPYRFPILTANFKSDLKEKETEWFEYVAKMNKNGFLNVNYSPRFAMCCRLNLEFDFKQNSFGGGGVKIGSMRVANINLPRIAYKSLDTQIYKPGIYANSNSNLFLQRQLDPYYDFFYLLELCLEDAMKHITAYSKIFEELIDVGYLKFFTGLSNWYNKEMFFGTIGFCGIWDAAQILLENQVINNSPELFIKEASKKPHLKKHMFEYMEDNLLNESVEIMERIVDLFVKKTKEFSNGIKFNVEEVPSESAAGTMAEFNKDYNETKKYYSNQFLPLELDIPFHIRTKIESHLQSKLTGGGMTFLNFDAPLTEEQSLHLHKQMMDLGFTGQFCINYGYSYCEDCGHTTHGKSNCELCGGETDFYTRVVGYLAKQKNSCKSKSLEISNRKYY